MNWNVVVICITIIVLTIIVSRIYLRLKLNKDFAIKGDNILSYIYTFRDVYMEDWFKNGGKDTKFKGKGVDLCTLLKTIERIINSK